MMFDDVLFDEELLQDESAVEFEVRSASDAYIASLNKYGAVNLTFMSQISGLPIDELIKQLNGLAMVLDPVQFEKNQDPYSGWIPVELYRSGNIYDKLQVAKKMNLEYRLFDKNIDILEKAMPKELGFFNIHVSLGATWVPERIYQDFIMKTLKLFFAPAVHYSKESGRWNVKGSEYSTTVGTVTCRVTYGTRRASALEIIEDTMNGKAVKVYDHYKDEGKSVSELNMQETMNAQEKQNLLIEEFYKFLMNNPNYMKDLQKIYSRLFNCNIGSKFDGSFLILPDINPAIKLYKHQMDAIARIILTQNVLLSHAVGAGKTYEMVVGCHERYRMGLSKKSLMVVPNNVFSGAVDAHRELYPDDKILVISPQQFKPEKREKYLEQIRTGDYVAIYMAYSSFDMLDMSIDYRISESLRRQEDIMNTAHDHNSSSWEWRECNRLRDREFRNYLKLREERNSKKQSELACFDKLGITSIYVDEAHNYKNITIATNAEGVVGMHKTGSKKCNSMLEKVRYVQQQNGNVVFATGTPLTNSMSDLYVLMKYLQYPTLRFFKIDFFDNFINTFGERSKNFEIDIDSVNFRFMTRFSSFHNIPELMSLFSEVCDYCNPEDSVFDLPNANYLEEVVDKSIEQDAYIKSLAERAEAIRAKEVSRAEDNLLKITTDGRKCALDIRLVEPEATAGIATSKVARCAARCYDLYKEYDGCSQIIFCDISTPREGFNMYQELKEWLISYGVPENEIAFVHEGVTEAKRKKILDDLDKGKLRFMVGSTFKLGQGVNVQTNLIAVHHLDIPWRPADMVQREGRLIRQGNRNKEVFIYRYVTQGSFDAYNWQLLENKQRFISAFLEGNNADRSQRDISEAVLSYSEIKALAIGNDLIRKRVEVANELSRMRMADLQRKRDLESLASICAATPKRVEKVRRHKANVEKDVAFYSARLDKDESVSKDDRIAFGESLIEALNANVMQFEERVHCIYKGFELILPKYMKSEESYVLLRGKNSLEYAVKMDDAKALGCITRLDNCLNHLVDLIAKDDERIKSLYHEKQLAEEDIATGNQYTDIVDELSTELLLIDHELQPDEEERGA